MMTTQKRMFHCCLNLSCVFVDDMACTLALTLHAAGLQLRAAGPVTEGFAASTMAPITHVALQGSTALAAEVNSCFETV